MAWGSYNNGARVLGLRWNGSEGDAGYPKLFGNPVWLLIPEVLTVPIVTSLIGLASADQEAVIRVLKAAGKSEILTF